MPPEGLGLCWSPMAPGARHYTRCLLPQRLYDPHPARPSASRPFRPGRHKTNRLSGALCQKVGMAHDRGTGRLELETNGLKTKSATSCRNAFMIRILRAQAQVGRSGPAGIRGTDLVALFATKAGRLMTEGLADWSWAH